MIRKRKPFTPRQRDNHPSLTFTAEQEAIITRQRFVKAELLSQVMADEGLTYADGERLTNESWDILRRMARVNEPSLVTRMLALELLRYRGELIEWVKSNGHRIEDRHGA